MSEKLRLIKFSHDYMKLPAGWIGKQARLIDAIPTSIKRLKETCLDFLAYDTRYRYNPEHKEEPGHYPLHFETGLVLLFYHIQTKTIFTTIRPFNPEKYAYYTALRGKIFTLAYTGK